MSTGLTTIQQVEFDAQVKAAYQKSGLLRPHVRVKIGVVGSTCKFRRYSKGVATPRVPQTDVTAMGTSYAEATASMSDWNAPEYTDVFDQATTNVDERQVVAANIAAALGRREDQLIVEALDAANPSANVDTNVGGAGTGLNLAKLRKAKRLMDERGVDATERCFVHSAAGLEALLGVTEVTSADFNTVRALVAGEIDTFLNFRFVMMEERTEGGLPYAGGLRTNFAFHKQAAGLAIGIDFRVEVTYVAEKTSWLANGLFKAGAAAIDPGGVIEVQTTE